MYALISPAEQACNNQGVAVGQRVAQVSDHEFPVALPLFWIMCADGIKANDYYYDPATQTIQPIES